MNKGGHMLQKKKHQKGNGRIEARIEAGVLVLLYLLYTTFIDGMDDMYAWTVNGRRIPYC